MPRRSGYQIPTVLQDLVMVDMLEITGTMVAAAQTLNLSQPTVSRRYRALAEDLGLRRIRQGPPGARFGDSPCLSMLRAASSQLPVNCNLLFSRNFLENLRQLCNYRNKIMHASSTSLNEYAQVKRFVLGEGSGGDFVNCLCKGISQ